MSSTHDYIHTRKCTDNVYIKFSKDQYEFAIDENSPIGSKIGTPITLDNFDQGYMLNVKGDDFTISPRTGQLYSRIGLDYERHGQNQSMVIQNHTYLFLYETRKHNLKCPSKDVIYTSLKFRLC